MGFLCTSTQSVTPRNGRHIGHECAIVVRADHNGVMLKVTSPLLHCSNTGGFAVKCDRWRLTARDRGPGICDRVGGAALTCQTRPGLEFGQRITRISANRRGFFVDRCRDLDLACSPGTSLPRDPFQNPDSEWSCPTYVKLRIGGVTPPDDLDTQAGARADQSSTDPTAHLPPKD